MRVALSEVLGALSYALDLTEGEPPGHAVRTTAIGMRLAEQISLSDEERSSLFYALLLKDAGCSANAARLSSLFGASLALLGGYALDTIGVAALAIGATAIVAAPVLWIVPRWGAHPPSEPEAV